MKRKIVLIVVGLTLISTSSSAERYEIRYGELFAEMSTFDRPQGLQKLLTEKVNKQFEERDKKLEEARKLLQDTSTSQLQNNDKWVDLHQTEADKRLQNFISIANEAKSLVEKNKLPEKLKATLLTKVYTWVMAVGSQQARFHQKLASMPLAKLRDRLVENNQMYNEEINNLNQKWTTLDSNDRSIDSTSKGVRDALVKSCTALKTTLDRERKDLASSINSNLRSAKDSSRLRQTIQRHSVKMIDALKRFESNARSHVTKLAGTINTERSVIRMLSETRSAVDDFHENRNLNTAQSVATELTGNALNTASTPKSAGDQKDLTAYVNKAIQDVTNAHLKAFKDTYGKFTSAFNGKFLDEVNSSTIQQFVEVSEWEQWSSQIKSCDQSRYLKALSSQAKDKWNVSLSSAQDEKVRKEVEASLNESARQITSAVNSCMQPVKLFEALATLQERENLEDLLTSS